MLLHFPSHKPEQHLCGGASSCGLWFVNVIWFLKTWSSSGGFLVGCFISFCSSWLIWWQFYFSINLFIHQCPVCLCVLDLNIKVKCIYRQSRLNGEVLHYKYIQVSKFVRERKLMERLEFFSTFRRDLNCSVLSQVTIRFLKQVGAEKCYTWKIQRAQISSAVAARWSHQILVFS